MFLLNSNLLFTMDLCLVVCLVFQYGCIGIHLNKSSVPGGVSGNIILDQNNIIL